MGIRDTFDDIARSVDKVAGALGSLNEQVDRAAGTKFTVPPDGSLLLRAPASFNPPQPAPIGSPSNPVPSTGFPPGQPLAPGTLFDSFGRPIERPSFSRSSGTGGERGAGGGGKSIKLDENILIPTTPPGGPLMRRSDLDGYVAMGVCDIMELPSGGHMISCPWGLYSGTGGVLSSVSGRSSRDRGTNPSGANAPRPDSTGNLDRTHRFRDKPGNLDRRPDRENRKFGGSSVAIDSRPITDRLDGLRDDVQNMTRALQGDGGAGVRFKGGF